MSRLILVFAVATAVFRLSAAEAVQTQKVPGAWDQSALDDMDVPTADPAYRQKAVSPEYYYRIPVTPIYKSYPVYAPGRAPAGYMQQLRRLPPQLAFNPARIKTKEHWIRAGESVFDAPTTYGTEVSMDEVLDPAWYAATGVPIANDGTVPWVRYVIRSTGNVELGNLSCGFCHTRVLPDGSVLKGAQSNFAFDRAIAFRDRRRGIPDQVRNNWLGLFTVQWVPDMQRRLEQSSLEDIFAAHDAIPPGVFARNRSSPFYPPAMPDLIGVVDHRYLDRTGSTRHRSIGDLMRYASLAQGVEFLSSFGGFIPSGEERFSKLPAPATQERFSDEQLYALALYVYSLRPPRNPNRFDATAQAGKRVFEREGCGGCHTPPLYTNNKLLPVSAFRVPTEHLSKYDILNVPINTDPRLTLQTRRGTGYYKVPSLRGAWYRSAFEHNGSVATLDDWFDNKRLRDDYVPTRFAGYGVKTKAVKGHLFGLNLPETDKTALVAFLKTL